MSLAGSAIVLFWGLIVAFQRGYASWQKKDYDYKFWDAVGDYFFYGYRYYRRRADLAKDNQSVRFHLNYLDQFDSHDNGGRWYKTCRYDGSSAASGAIYP